MKAEDAPLAQIQAAALELVVGSRPGVVLTETNGTGLKGCTWRVVRKPDGGYLMNILNLGKNTAQLKIAQATGGLAAATDLLTGRKLGADFELKPNGVLLLAID